MDQGNNDNERWRHARMRIDSAALISHRHGAWSSELEDISATGVRVARPQDWTGEIGDLVTLDMLVGESLNIHVQATVARITENYIGFAYERIPEEKEVPLWNLLGGYADALEPWDDELPETDAD